MCGMFLYMIEEIRFSVLNRKWGCIWLVRCVRCILVSLWWVCFSF